MSSRLPSFLELDQYGITADDIAKAYLKCSPDQISQKVILTPTWGPDIFAKYAERVSTVSEGVVWLLKYRGQPITVVRTGMGSALADDYVLALGCTSCETIIFAGSVGGLNPSMAIGDLVIAEESVCGEGFSRCLEPQLEPNDCFYSCVSPSAGLTRHLVSIVEGHPRRNSVPVHYGAVFSTDSILAETP